MSRTRLTIALIPGILLGALFIVIAVLDDPVPEGESAKFWHRATGVELPDYRESASIRRREHGFFESSGGVFRYYTQTHHDRTYHVVDADSVAARLPEVVALLKSPVDHDSLEYPPRGARPWALRAYREWVAAHGSDPTDAEAFVRALHAARMRYVFGDSAAVRSAREIAVLNGRLAHARRVWATYLFEWAFLTGWVLFLLWPWISRRSPIRWALHVAIAPLLLFVPYFLGYAGLTFTYGPPGGFVYPLVLELAAAPWQLLPYTTLDAAILNSLPPVLWPLSNPVGPMAALSRSAIVGPTGLLLMGAVLGALTLSVRVLMVRRRSTTVAA